MKGWKLQEWRAFEPKIRLNEDKSIKTNFSNPMRASPWSMSRVLTIVVTKLMMLDQPLYPTLLDDVNMKTRSTIFVLQSDSTL